MHANTLNASFSKTGKLELDALGQARQYLEHAHWMNESQNEYCVHEFAAISQAAAQIAQAETDQKRNEYLATIAEHLAGILEKLSNIDSTLWDARGPDGSIKGAQ